MPKRKIRRPPPPQRPSQGAPVANFTLRVAGGTVQPRPVDAGEQALEDLATRWSYRMRNRTRWRDDATASANVEDGARADLERLGIEAAQLQQIADAGLVEVSVPVEATRGGWEPRLPWEPLLASATRALRQGRPLLVVRHLDRPQRPLRRVPERALMVISEPGRLRGQYTFDSERRLIEAHLVAKTRRVLESPTAAALADEVRSHPPDVVHLTGFDAHQGAALLERDDPDSDGLFLADARGNPALCGADELAAALAEAATAPRVVTCNAYYSAPRIAARIVALGAEAAIGFQDEIDDSVAENFFASFYRAWTLSQFDLLQAFRYAWQEARDGGALRGSGIVLWSSRPCVAPGATAGVDLAKAVSSERSTPIVLGGRGAGRDVTAWDVLQWEVEPLPALNYGLLHNGGSLFDRFMLRKLRPGVLRDVRVKVVLSVGPQEFSYRESFDLERPATDISSLVRLPLTWEYIRSMRENTRTGLYVEIQAGEHTVHCRTYPVVLLPVEEWRDTKRDGKWLPSFVLPRDPAVAAVVDRAQRYLMALRDDAGAGFDGYQAVEPAAADPSEGVDLQVQAIWSALVYDYGLAYINPPPTYTSSSQRLRCPQDVVDGRRGTCIDLALLLASCLEYVEIYPVLFLLKGHAFPGYWRSEEAQREFVAIKRAGAGSRSTAGVTQLGQWVIPADAYDEIVGSVRANQLVPLETVWLTQHRGFGEATQAGIEDLDERAEFEAMLDVLSAREAGVTPLPLRGSLR